jgi:hypothetical protein
LLKIRKAEFLQQERENIELGDAKVADCTIMLSRGGAAKANVLFRRGFVPELLNASAKLDAGALAAHAEGRVAALKQEGARKKLERCTETASSARIRSTSGFVSPQSRD